MNTSPNLNVEICGLGSYLPEKVLTNHDLEQMVETSDEWITKRTGIKERRIAAEDEATSDLAANAAREALADAGMGAEDVELIIVCTCSPDHLFPATACLVQEAIGADNAMAYDLEAACSGFVYGLMQGGAMVASGMTANALVIGAETLSRLTDWTDRGSCILFGDGAGAAVLKPSSGTGKIHFAEAGADGGRPDILKVPAGGSRNPCDSETIKNSDHYMTLEGREVFKYAVGKLGELVDRIPEETDTSLQEVDMIIPHQSNERIIRSVCERAELPKSCAYMNIDRVGNTSAASIPLALHDAVRDGKLNRGDLLLLVAFGGGITWGSMLLTY
ncbi:MAG: beta-ketoacyl-ACP synthase III [Planctomycetota bacterium]